MKITGILSLFKRLASLPSALGHFALLQSLILLVIVCLCVVHFTTIWPQQQQLENDVLADEFAYQLQLLGPLTQEKVQLLVESSSRYRNVDLITVRWQHQPREFSFDPATTASASTAFDGWPKNFGLQQFQSTVPVYREQAANATEAGNVTLYNSVSYSSTLWAVLLPVSLMVLVSLSFTLLLQRRLQNESSELAELLDPDTSAQEKNRARDAQGKLLGNLRAAILQGGNNNQHASGSDSPETQEDIPKAEIVSDLELQLARKSAYDASQLKMKIIANTSHELLTPLNSIVGFSELLLQDNIRDEQAQNFLSRINDNANHLSALVNDLLDQSTIDDGQIKLSYSTVDVFQLFQSIAETLAQEANNKSLELLTNFDVLAGYQLETDPLRLRQIITNLLVNAIRNTEQGHILFSASIIEDEQATDSKNRRLDIIIEDTGKGIPEEMQGSIFAPYIRADSANSTSPKSAGDLSDNNDKQGFGLGLSIVRNLADRLGASVLLDSTPGEGSTFCIRLPVTGLRRHPSISSSNIVDSIYVCDAYLPGSNVLCQRLEKICNTLTVRQSLPKLFKTIDSESDGSALIIINYPESKQANTDWKALLDTNIPVVVLVTNRFAAGSKEIPVDPNIHLLCKPFSLDQLEKLLQPATNQAATGNTLTTGETMSGTGSKARVLVVDDNSSNIELLSFLLEKLDCEVLSASNGNDALVLSAENNFDLVLLDVRMEPMDGITLFNKMRTQLRQQNTPIIACTAHTSDQEFRILKDTGFDDITYKPLHLSQLKALCLKHIGKQRTTVADFGIDGDERLTGFYMPLDIQAALQKSAGNHQLAQKMFSLLVEELEKAHSQIANWKSKSAQAILNDIHRLHGATRMTAVKQLEQGLYALESKIKAGEDNIEKDLDQLRDDIERLVNWHKDTDLDVLFG